MKQVKLKVLLMLLCCIGFYSNVAAQCNPGNLLFTSATLTGVTFNLNNNSGGINYVEYGPVGFTPGTGSAPGTNGTIVQVPTNQNYIAVTGLTAGTAYHAYTRKDCAGIWSINSNVKTFNTAYDCGQGPYISCDVMNTYIHPGGTGAWYSLPCVDPPFNGTYGQGSEIIYNFVPQMSGMFQMFVPQNNIAFDFSWKEASQGCDENGWNCIGSNNYHLGTSNQFEFGPLTAGNTYYIRVDKGSTTNSTASSSFRIECPNCITITNVIVKDITTNSANFTFSGSPFTVIVEYGLTGFTPGTGNTPGTGGTIVTTNSYSGSLIGLQPSTSYDIYIRLPCNNYGGVGYSPNSIKQTFSTKNCPLTYPSYAGGVQFDHTYPGDYSSIGNTGVTTNGNEVAYQFVAPSSGYFDLQLSSPWPINYSVMSVILTQNCAIGGVNNLFGSLWWYGPITWSIGPLVGGQTYELIFDVDPVALPTGSYVNINLKCPKPVNPWANNIGPNSVDIHWDCNSSGTSPCQSLPIIEYGPYGFTPGTGTTPGTNGTVITNLTSSFYHTLTGLQPNTYYDVYLRTVCGTLNSDNGTKLTIKTSVDCSSATVISCGQSVSYQNYYATTYSGQTVGAWAPSGCGNNIKQSREYLWKFTPATTGVYELNFHSIYTQYFSGGATTNIFMKEENAGCNETGWNCMGSMSYYNATFVPTIISLGTLTAGTTYMILADGYQPTFSGQHYTYSFQVQCPNVCGPAALSTAVQQYDQVTIYGNCNGCTGSTYLEYGPAGFTPGADDQPGVGGTVIANITFPYVVTGLTNGATYDFYARNYCPSNTLYSVNSNKLTSTPCYNLPTGITAAGGGTICAGNSETLTVNGGTLPAGGNFVWYAFTCNTTPIGTGTSIVVSPSVTTTYNVRIESPCGNSNCFTKTVIVSDPVANNNPQGPTSFCDGGSVDLFSTTGSGYSYQWYKDGIAINGAIASWYNADASGDYKVLVTIISTGCSKYSPVVTVTENANPVVSFSGLAVSYSDIDPPATLTGNPAGGTFSGPGVTGNQFNPGAVGVGGPYTIVYNYTDGNGCSGSSSKQTSVTGCTAAPPQPGAINMSGGYPTVCPGESRTYSISAVTGANSYTWTPPAGATITSGQGTTIVNVAFDAGFTSPGNISVVAINNCGTSPASTLNIGLNNPATPGTISGPVTGVCDINGLGYSVTNITGMTYTWSFNSGSATIASGQGTAAITANFGTFTTLQLSVYGSNGCGTSNTEILDITGAPQMPASITGPGFVCSTQQNVMYSVNPEFGATTYTWYGPPKTKISDGVVTSNNSNNFNTTSNVIYLSFNKKSGIVKARANNNCGSSAYQQINVGFNCREGELSVVPTLTLVPNPANEKVFLDFEEEGAFTVEVYNVIGALVMQAKQTHELNVMSLQPGIYLIKVKDEHHTYTQRLIRSE